MPANFADNFKIEKFFDTQIFKTDVKINKTLEGITVAPKLTKDERNTIAKAYTKNLDKYIKDFSEKEIVELRSKIEKNVLEGGRYESMVDIIEKSYGVSKRKAKFLARQETGLMMSEFKKVRYLDAGVKEYIWTCAAGSPKHPVRPMHKALDGKKFSWNNPPITDEKGNRNNPGEDFNCRCYAIPVVKF